MSADSSFASLGLSEPILKAVQEQGYDTPSPIQAKAIPEVLAGHDVMAAAQTGTGKTAGFTLPMLERLVQSAQNDGNRVKSNHIRALVLTPTRELAAQVHDSVRTYSKHLRIFSTSVYGGVKINPQMMRLRKGVDILIATPGRLLDLYQQNAVKFNQVEIFVLDEADRMLDMGFIDDIQRIMRLMPKQRQNLLFSATFSDEINDLAESIVNNPVKVSVAARNTTAKTIKQWLCPVDKKRKSDVLLHLITENEWEQVLVFTNTKHGANRLVDFINDWGIKAAAIHGNKSQGARTKALADFKNRRVRVLVATDIAARGIDIDQLPQVVNFDLPKVAEDYVHRIGRTGRAGSTGQAISLVSNDEFKSLTTIERLIQKHIEREYVDGFIPNADLPAPQTIRPLRPKKPKKKKPSHGQGDDSRAESPRRSSGASRRGQGQSSRNKKFGAKPRSERFSSDRSDSFSESNDSRGEYRGKRNDGSDKRRDGKPNDRRDNAGKRDFKGNAKSDFKRDYKKRDFDQDKRNDSDRDSFNSAERGQKRHSGKPSFDKNSGGKSYARKGKSGYRGNAGHGDSDSRSSDNRGSDNRSFDNRGSDSRRSGGKSFTNKNSGNKSSGNKAYRGGHHSDTKGKGARDGASTGPKSGSKSGYKSGSKSGAKSGGKGGFKGGSKGYNRSGSSDR